MNEVLTVSEKILNVAVFFGGFSSEYSVSLESAYSVISNLNPEKYRALPVGITRDGKWFYFDGDIQKISNSIFLIAPNNVGIMSEEDAEAKNSFAWGN